MLACQPYDETAKLPLVRRQHAPMMYRFIDDIIYKRLSPLTFDHCVKKLRRLDWSDPSIAEHVIRRLAQPNAVRHEQVPALASAVFHLGR